MSIIRLLLVDQSTAFIQRIQNQLTTQVDIEIVGHSTQHQHTLSLCAEYEPHILILGQGYDDSLSLIRTVRSRHPNISIILITEDIDAKHARQHLQAGVIGYLLRDDAVNIADAILIAHQGKAIISTEVTRALL